jgi:hypothetical protein
MTEITIPCLILTPKTTLGELRDFIKTDGCGKFTISKSWCGGEPQLEIESPARASEDIKISPRTKDYNFIVMSAGGQLIVKENKET